MNVRVMGFCLLVVLGSVGGSMAAMACDCAVPTQESAKQTYAEADIIIRAKVLRASQGWDGTGGMTKMEVLQVLKGDDAPETVTVNYNNSPMTCGHDLKEGDEGIYALYDTRDIGVTNAQNRGYGFRMMISCAQDDVRYYINNLYLDKKEEK